MTNQQLARLLVEKVGNANINKKVAVFVNRLMLRLHSQPALMANLADVSVFKPGIETDTRDQVEDGRFHENLNEEATGDDTPTSNDYDRALHDPDKRQGQAKEKEKEDDNSVVILQLSFRRLPQEVIAPMIRLIAAPRDPKLFRYTKDGSARTGVEMELKPSDFPGDDYEYAF